MRNKLIRSVFFLLCFFIIWTEKNWAFSFPADSGSTWAENSDDYLWLEFKKCVKEEDGSVTLPLQINYGKFSGEQPSGVVNSARFIREKQKKILSSSGPSPRRSGYGHAGGTLVSERKKDLSELDALRAFYTLNEKDNEGNRIFYETSIKRDKGSYTVYIKASKASCIVVLVEGKKIYAESTRYYSAKTSFVLFGHSPFEEKAGNPVVSGSEINRQLEICISPEFSYWPQTGVPIKITPLFNGACMPERVISIFDENNGAAEITTGKTGSYTYVPPEDNELNWSGDTAFKQAVIVAGEKQGNGTYLSSYTHLLHRSRFGNRKKALGAAIFGAAIAGTLLFIGVKRRRFKI